MAATPTCPATLEMLRKGSPVITHDGPGVVLYVDGDAVLVYVERLHAIAVFSADALEMDLADATGRAHVAWWLGAQFGLSLPPLAWWWSAPRAGGLFVVGDTNEGRAEFGPPSDSPLSPGWWVLVPALAHLDPTDDTRLPDGSRLVDALALKAVVEHLVAGGDR